MSIQASLFGSLNYFRRRKLLSFGTCEANLLLACLLAAMHRALIRQAS